MESRKAKFSLKKAALSFVLGLIVFFFVFGLASGGSSEAQRVSQLTSSVESASDLSGKTTASVSGVSDEKTSGVEATSAGKEKKVDYLVLVSKNSKLSKNWEETVEFESFKNKAGEKVKVEKKTLKMFKKLRKALKKSGIVIDISSAYRSKKDQKKLIKELREKEGGEYIENYVSLPGFSEHQTGLALDINIIRIDQKKYTNASAISAFQKKLDSCGFILRYPKGKEKITGYQEEWWHIRFVGSKKTAKKIASKGWTLEEYLENIKKKK